MSVKLSVHILYYQLMIAVNYPGSGKYGMPVHITCTYKYVILTVKLK